MATHRFPAELVDEIYDFRSDALARWADDGLMMG